MFRYCEVVWRRRLATWIYDVSKKVKIAIWSCYSRSWTNICYCFRTHSGFTIRSNNSFVLYIYSGLVSSCLNLDQQSLTIMHTFAEFLEQLQTLVTRNWKKWVCRLPRQHLDFISFRTLNVVERSWSKRVSKMDKTSVTYCLRKSV